MTDDLDDLKRGAEILRTQGRAAHDRWLPTEWGIVLEIDD